MLFFWLACPGCGRHFDLHLGDYDFYPFLGPPRYVCPKCGTVYRSDRKEWAELSVIGKLLWLICSALLVAGTGLLGGISVMVARQVLAGGQAYPNGGVPFHQDRTFLAAFAAWAGVTLVLQSRRLVASRRRSAAAANAPFPATFFNLQVSLAPKYAASYLLPPLVCGVYNLVVLVHGLECDVPSRKMTDYSFEPKVNVLVVLSDDLHQPIEQRRSLPFPC